MKKIILLLAMCIFGVSLTAQGWGWHHKAKPTVIAPQTVLGIERLEEPEIAKLLEGKRVGVFTNQSGIDSKLRSSVDLIRAKHNVVSIFVPEHGLLGAVAAGEKFADSKYEGIQVFSLYGESRRPTKAMLDTIDLIAVDIQDIGIRHYTYTSSLAYIMEECAKNNKNVVVFDRPNPLGGEMQGPVLKPKFKSFIGLYEIPLRHGLTIGEFASFINVEKKINCKLNIVKMQNWNRSMHWSDTKLPWVQTSPLIPTAETAYLYGATGIAGDTKLSVGVGTAKPFYFVGAPFADAAKVTEAFQKLQLPGVGFRKAAFTPRYGRYKDELVQGAEIYILEPKKVNLSELEYSMIYTMQKMYPEGMTQLPKRYGGEGYSVDIALGDDSIEKHEDPAKLFLEWNQECDNFKKLVKPYLLYK